MLLYAGNGNATYLQKLQAYADAVCTDPAIHDASTNLCRLDGGSCYSLLDRASIVQVYACLGWGTGYGKLTLEVRTVRGGSSRMGTRGSRPEQGTGEPARRGG